MISVQRLPLCLPLFFTFSSEVLNSGIKSCFDGVFLKVQFVKNVLVYVFRVFTFSFCYSFYEGFIHKIILVSLFLPFICISYPLKVFKFDTGIFRDSCAVPLLKTQSRLPQSIAFLCLILFVMFACNNYPFRAFVTIIPWTSTEVLLNLDCSTFEF